MMDEIDRTILNEIQSAFPITSRPYKVLGEKLGLEERDVLARVKKLRSSGVVRRIGGNFQSKRLNFTSTLCAAKVPKEKLSRFVEVVNGYPGVTHNYLRSHDYNVWFTFIAPDMGRINRDLKVISEATGVDEILNLPSVRMFKIKVDFPV